MTSKGIIKYRDVVENGNVYKYPILSPKLESFAMQLIPNRLNLRKALMASQYETKPGNANKHATQLWNRQDLREWLSVHLERLKDQIPREAQEAINEVRIIQELVAIAYTHMGQLVTWNANGDVKVTPSKDLTQDELASIKKVKCNIHETVNEDGQVTSRKTTIELEQHAKLTAIDMLAKLRWDWYKRVGAKPNDDDEPGKKKGYIVVPQPEKRVN